MKVLYLIYVAGHGRGGHFYSLLETANKISEHKEVVIVSLGVNRSPVFEKSPEKYIHIEDEGLVRTTKRLVEVARQEKAGLIHSFDIRAFLFARLVSLFTGFPLLLTKCGGSNPKRYFPYHSDIVLFSPENHVWFKEKEKFKKTNTPVIANRVDIDPSRQDLIRIAELRQYLVPDTPVILRIARIGTGYEKSILQGIRLTERLNASGVSVQFLLIGAIQDECVFNNLMEFSGDNVKIITDDRFTINASELINVADVVIGTGRSFMEAALLNKVMLSPASNLSLPVLAITGRVENIFKVNFSERYKADITDEEAFSELHALFRGSAGLSGNSSIAIFSDCNFSSKRLYEKYKPVYEAARPAKFSPFDLMRHWWHVSGIKSRVKSLFKNVK